MSENRDPKTCPSCETVNAWSAETCRTCGTDLSNLPVEPDSPVNTLPEENGQDQEETPVPGTSQPSMDSLYRPSGSFRLRRWNIFWIMLGIGIHVMSFQLGGFAILKYFIQPDPELASRLEQNLESAKMAENATIVNITEGASDAMLDKIQTIRTIFIVFIVSLPLVIGAVIGFFSGNILEGAASMGLSAVLIPLLNNAALYAVIWGPINSGLGALGAFLGYLLGRRVKQS